MRAVHLHIARWAASRSDPSPPGPAFPTSRPDASDHQLWLGKETRFRHPCYCKPWCPEIIRRDWLAARHTERHTSDWKKRTLLQLWWSSRLSTESAISLTLRLLNSGLSWAALPSSVVQTGVKSRGWENRTPQLMEETLSSLMGNGMTLEAQYWHLRENNHALVNYNYDLKSWNHDILSHIYQMKSQIFYLINMI